MKAERHKKPPPPLDQAGLERLALRYVERYATTRAKLLRYLNTKLRERGWSGCNSPAPDKLAERFVELGYVDDAAFAAARSASLQRRGYGERRVGQALRAAGVGEDDASAAMALTEEEAMQAALRFARRKQLGPYAPAELDWTAKRKAFGAFMRAGHSMDVVRRLLDLSPDDIPDSDSP